MIVQLSHSQFHTPLSSSWGFLHPGGIGGIGWFGGQSLGMRAPGGRVVPVGAVVVVVALGTVVVGDGDGAGAGAGAGVDTGPGMGAGAGDGEGAGAGAGAGVACGAAGGATGSGAPLGAAAAPESPDTGIAAWAALRDVARPAVGDAVGAGAGTAEMSTSTGEVSMGAMVVDEWSTM